MSNKGKKKRRAYQAMLRSKEAQAFALQPSYVGTHKRASLHPKPRFTALELILGRDFVRGAWMGWRARR